VRRHFRGRSFRLPEQVTGSQPLERLTRRAVPRVAPHARALGRGWALTGMLRAAAFHAASRRCYLPTQLLLRHGVALESWFAGRPERGAEAVIRDVASAAHSALAGVDRGSLPRSAFAVAGLRVLARLHLDRVAAAGHDAFSPALQAPTPMAASRLALAKLLGRW